MVPPLKDDPMEAAGAVHGEAFGLKSDTSSSKTSPNDDLNIAFSHVQLYVDKVENIKTYKELENSLNQFIKLSAKDDSEEGGLNGNGAASRRDLWQSITKTHSLSSGASDFIPQNRDVVKQMIVGFGFRVTGFRFATKENNANTRSILVTSKDSNGVQVIVTARDDNATARASDDYRHFDAAYMDTFYGVHSNRQGKFLKTCVQPEW